MNKKLTAQQVGIIKAMIIAGYPNKYIAEKFNVKPNTISDIRRNKSWKHIKPNSDINVPPVPKEMLKGRLRREQVAVIKAMINAGYPNKHIAKKFNVSPGTISNIKQNKSWTHVEPNSDIDIPPAPEEMLQSKLDQEQVGVIKAMMAAGYPNKYIAEKFNVSPGTISDIRRGKSWRHVKPNEQLDIPPAPRELQRGKLDEKQVARIKLLMSKCFSNKELAEMFNVSPGTISDIKQNKSWAHVDAEEFSGDEWEIPIDFN